MEDSTICPTPLSTHNRQTSWNHRHAVNVLIAAHVSHAAFIVAVVLLQYASFDTARCHPGIRALARETRYSKDRVGQAITELESRGLLCVQRGKGTATNSYYCKWAVRP